MTNKVLEYRLEKGFIDNWLVAGPQVTAVQDVKGTAEEIARQKKTLAQKLHKTGGSPSPMPVDQGTSDLDGLHLHWNYWRCQEDHLVDVSGLFSGWGYSHAWAYTQLELPADAVSTLADPVQFVLFASGPADVWINGEPVFRHEDFSSDLESQTFSARLAAQNEIMVRFEQAAYQVCEQEMALRLVGLPEETAQSVKVIVPTSTRYPSRHQKLEQVFDKAYLEQVVNHHGVSFNLRWAEDLDEEIRYSYQVQDADERIYVEGTWDSSPKQPLDIGHGYRLFERQFFVTLRAPGKEYFEQNMRYQRKMPLYVLDTPYSTSPYGEYPQRAREALEDAAKREDDLFGVIAQMELGQWKQVNKKTVLKAVGRVQRREVNSEVLLLGLLGMIYRYAGQADFPADLKQPLEEGIFSAPFEAAAAPSTAALETRTIVSAVCAVLMGQLYPENLFTIDGLTGADLRARGEQAALTWMQARCTGGFMDWDSNSDTELVLAALAHLTSRAENEDLAELSAVLMDKILVLLAVHSFQGVYAGTHGRTHASMLKTAQLEATSGVSRMLWGMGVFNKHTAGTVSLATSQYEFPTFFTQLAADQPEEMLSKCRSAALANDQVTAEVNRVFYKTPDYMLSSAQDYCPGAKGSAQHIWQATLGPDAVVFASHPACISEHEAHQPGFWLGNAVLPRVAQWKDVLVAVYNSPAGEAPEGGLDFTHAYFPVYTFDEHAFQGGWAFARKGSGYLAITAAQEFELVKHAPDGYRELRSAGRQNVWLVQMGREALDGSFAAFQEQVLGRGLEWQENGVRYSSLRGEEIGFGWSSPLLVNGVEQPLSGFKHIDNRYCQADLPAKAMEINFDEILLRLDFE